MEVATACIEHPRRVESPLLKVIVRYAVERDANAPRKREERNALAKTLSTLLLTGDASGAADGAPLALKPHLGVMVLKGIDYTCASTEGWAGTRHYTNYFLKRKERRQEGHALLRRLAGIYTELTRTAPP